MIKTLKNWFWKRDKESSQDSDDALDSCLRNELHAYILIASHKTGEDFVACNFCQGFRDKVAKLLFYLYSGYAVEECVKSLNEVCDSSEELQQIVEKVQELLTQIQQQKVPDGPVVDPCNVFKGGVMHDNEEGNNEGR